MVDWNDIKKAFESEKTPEQLEQERERRFLASVAEFLSSGKGVSSIMGYHPEEISAFLEKAPAEIQKLLGGEWAEMEEKQLDLMVYNLLKKVKKSENLLEW